jgi:ABC-type nitrate/sulfonate/bicarbonate transport system substrate-binding protein
VSDLTRGFAAAAQGFTRRAVVLVGVVSLVAACTGAATPAPTAAPTPAPTTAASAAATAAATKAPLVAGIPNPKIAVTAPPSPSQIQKYGMVLYGSQFGLKSTAADFVTFNDNVASIASLLNGQSDVIHGAFLSQVSTVVQGQPLVIFGPAQMTDDYHVVAAPPIATLEDVVKAGVTIAVDGPGQGASARFQAMLMAKGITARIQDLTGVKIIGSNGERATAFANGQVQVAVIDGIQANTVIPKVAGSKIVASLQDSVPGFLASSFAATKDWLAKNQSTAEALCAAVILGSREMVKDFTAFSNAVKSIMPTAPSETELRRVWDIVRKYELWPINGDLDRAGFDLMTRIGVSQGIFPTAPTYESIIDRKFADAAMARLGTVDKATLTK